LSKNNVSVVHDPSSNMKLANGIAPIVKMYNEGINICLGTDGAASNNSLNLWNEIRLAALVHKAITQDPTVMSAPQILKMATENGAKALGMSNSLGRIEKDMLADLVVLDLDALSFHPPNDIISDLAYSTNGSEVKDVIANGKFIMKDREILTIDIQEVKSRIDEYAGQICV
ncbi:MAG: N-ethylammeline chlorohydrolase, partial [Thermotoga sp.]